MCAKSAIKITAGQGKNSNQPIKKGRMKKTPAYVLRKHTIASGRLRGRMKLKPAKPSAVNPL
jgi:hypothetical protein